MIRREYEGAHKTMKLALVREAGVVSPELVKKAKVTESKIETHSNAILKLMDGIIDELEKHYDPNAKMDLIHLRKK